MTRLARTLLAAALIVAPAGFTAAAHHGWAWAEEEQSEVTGTVDTIDMASAHPQLTVTADDGVWTVELGNPRQTQTAGFTADSVKPGDTITALGNKAANGDKRIKSVRLTSGDKVFTFYPDRIRE